MGSDLISTTKRPNRINGSKGPRIAQVKAQSLLKVLEPKKFGLLEASYITQKFVSKYQCFENRIGY